MIRLTLLAVVCLAPPDGLPGTPGPEPSYEQKRAASGRDAGAQVELALWCEAHGLERERLKHLAVAVLADPSNAMARGLMGLVEYGGRWKRPEAVAEAVRADVKHADLMAEYAGRRVRTPVKPDAQWKLALWCEEKGLKDESRAHLATVVRLDPTHADAWKKLGYKKVGNRWVTEARAAAEKTERQLQQEADKKWRPRLERLREALDGKGQRKDEALRELSEVADPRAVPAVWHALVERGGNHQIEAVQVLGQIDAIEASRALATLAVSAKSDEVRRRATETLRRRDPREWADLLIAMLSEPIKYGVKKVGGPGSAGELYVEGKKANTKRLYTPPAPFVPFLPGDTMETDARGRPVLVHHFVQPAIPIFNPAPPPWMGGPMAGNPWGFGVNAQAPTTAPGGKAAEDRVRTLLPPGAANAPLTGAVLASDPIAQAQMASYLEYQEWVNLNNRSYAEGERMDPKSGFPEGAHSVIERPTVKGGIDRQVRVSLGDVADDARRAVATAQGQLDQDVRRLQDYNDRVAERNSRIAAVLAAATGVSLPAEPAPWRVWFVDQLGFKLATPGAVPTVIEQIPIAFQPIATSSLQVAPVPIFGMMTIARHSCFGRGTPVRTASGLRPIETIEVGDLVLTQDTVGGKLGYRPVVMAHHNPPSPTFEVALGGDPIVTSPSHRFWVAGRGWVMARDLKLGDPVRTLGGVARVARIDEGKVQPVFNLDVEGDADFFVGEAAALVHDNTLPDLKQHPFDAPKAVAAK